MIDEWPASKTFRGPDAYHEAVAFYHDARRNAPTGVAYQLYEVHEDGRRQPFLVSDSTDTGEPKKADWTPPKPSHQCVPTPSGKCGICRRPWRR